MALRFTAAGLLFALLSMGCTLDFLNKSADSEPADYEVTTQIDQDGDGMADRTETRMKISGALIRYSLHQNEDGNGDGTKDRVRRTDYFDGKDQCLKIETYSYDSSGQKVQIRNYDGTGQKTGAESWTYDQAGRKVLTAFWNSTDQASSYSACYFDASGRNHRTAVFLPGTDGLTLKSQTVTTYLGDAAESVPVLRLSFDTAGALTGGESFSYRTGTTDAAVRTVYGAGGEITLRETVKWASDYLPETVPVEDFDLSQYELTVKETFVRGLRAVAEIPAADWNLLSMPGLPSEPATPAYVLGTDTAGLKRDVTEIQAFDPYGSTTVVLDSLTFNLADNSLLVGTAGEAQKKFTGLPDVVIPDADIPYRPRQIRRDDTRLAKTVTVDLTYDDYSRPSKKVTSYGDQKALELGFTYGAAGGGDEYLLTQVAATGEAMILPLSVKIGYKDRLPVSVEVISADTTLSSFEFLYDELAQAAAVEADGFDPVKVSQDPLAFGTRLLSLMEKGWTIRQYGLGSVEDRLPAAEYRFQPLTTAPGLKVSIHAYDDGAKKFSLYKGYYLLSMDQAEKVLKFQIWLGENEGTEALTESTVYAYGSWGDKLYDYKDELEGLKAGVEKELAGTDLQAFLGLGGGSMEDMAASLMTMLFR